ARPLDQHISQIALTGDDVGQGAFGSQAQQDIDIGQAKVGVEQHYPTTEFSQRQRQIDRYVGLADSALAASHRNHLYGMSTHLHMPISCWGHKAIDAFSRNASSLSASRNQAFIRLSVMIRCTTR